MTKALKTAVILALILAVAGCADNTTDKDNNTREQPDDITIGLKGGVFGYYPNITNYETTTMSMNSNIYEGLVSFDGEYSITPNLAEGWENPDDHTWRFHLRHGVTFHSGDAFDAHDVKFSIDHLLEDPDNVLYESVNNIERVEVVDNDTVDIITEEPTPILLNKLVDTYIISKETHTVKKGGQPCHCGTGPYILDENETKEDAIVLKRYDDYWQGTPPLKEVTFKVISDDDERAEALKRGDIDLAEHLPVDKREELERTEGIEVLAAPSTRVIFLGFDFREEDSYAYPDGDNPTADVKVRKAIYHAIDEKAIIEEVMGGAAEPASQFLPPHIFGYNPDIERLPYNQSKARELLNEAGYPEGFDIEFDCPTDRYVNDKEICEAIAEDLSEVGVNATLNAQPKKEFFPKVLARNTSFHLLGWAADTADGAEIFDYMLTTAGTQPGKGSVNLGYYSNPLVDEMGRRSSTTLDPEKRLTIMQEGFAIAMEDVAWVPLHLQSLLYGKASDVEWEPRADVKIVLDDISYDKG